MRLLGKTRSIALGGILLALAFALSALENAIPLPLPGGVKPGLSNVIIMFALFHINTKTAITVNFLKSCLVFLTRGMTAFLMSLCGGMLSLLIIVIIYMSIRPSLIFISVSGAISHNIGQICIAALLLKSASVFSYLPVLIISGIATGILTGIVLRTAEPALLSVAGKTSFLQKDRQDK